MSRIQRLKALLGRGRDQEYDTRPWTYYEGVEYGTRLDDLIFVPMMAMLYIFPIAQAFGVQFIPLVNLAGAFGPILFFLLGTMATRAYLATKVQEYFYVQADLWFAKNKVIRYQLRFGKHGDDQNFHEIPCDTIHDAGIRQVLGAKRPVYLETGRVAMLLLLPGSIGETFAFETKDVVEMGQTTKGPRSQCTLEFLGEYTKPSLTTLTPEVIHVFNCVHSPWHLGHRQEVVS